MTKFAVKNPISVLVLAVMILLTGFMSYRGMPSESFPEIKIPLIFINTILPGGTPQDIELLVTRKIEDKLEGIDGVKKITSQSLESVSSIQVEFNPDVDVSIALQRVRDKVEQAKGELPTDAEDPLVQELNFSNIPIFTLSLTSDYSIEQLEEVAEELKDKMEVIPGILEVKVTGKREKEIAIDVDPEKLRSYNMNLGEISGAISNQHRNVPGGTLLSGGTRYSLKVTGELKNPEDFGKIVVKQENGRIIRLRDIATVTFAYTREPATISRLDGKPSLTINLTKRTGENIITIVDEAKRIVEESKARWPKGTHVAFTFDQSVDIRHMVNELQNHIILGVIFVMLSLWFFLGFRNSFFISTAIPFSMLIGFIVLSAMGVTLNMVTLFSLVIALGMLVDDGIVVVENIYRHMAEGKSKVESAIQGTKEVMIPVTTATITTVAAFMPIIGMPGVMGDFMKYLPITVSVTLLASLFVAFFFNPTFAALFMTTDAKHHDEEGGHAFLRFRNAYMAMLAKLVDRPILVALGCISFVIGGIVAYGAFGTGTVFFPKVEPDVVSMEIEGPLGLTIDRSDSSLKKLEERLFNIPKSVADIEHISALSGMGKGNMFSGGNGEPHKAYVNMKFPTFEDRKVSSWITAQWANDSLLEILPGWKVSVKEQESGPPRGKPVSFEISGEEFSVLSALSDSVVTRLKTVKNLVNIGTDYDPAQPELRIDIDRDQAKYLGVNTVVAASSVRSAIYGIEAGKFRQGENEYKIMVRNAPDSRESRGAIEDIVVSLEGKNVPLSTIAEVTEGAGLASIKHLARKRTVQVWAEIAPGVQDEQKVQREAAESVKSLISPSGYSVGTGSDNKDQQETQAYIGKALLIAIGLVFLTMVAQFNSLFQPFLVLIGIVLAIGGVFWGLLFTGVTFSFMMSGVGIVALAGVVAKNSIILIDFTNHLRSQGMAVRDAVLEAGKTRMRPVILTALTAMIGLLPMATGIGFDFAHFELVLKAKTSMYWASMAWAIFWGLLFNTFLVLIATPTFYLAYVRLSDWVAGLFGKGKPETNS